MNYGLTAAALLAAVPVSPADPQAVVGLWRTDDNKAEVRIDRCGPNVCGTVARILDAKVPKYDLNNATPSQRGRQLLGLTVLSGYRWSNGGWRDGHAYDAKSGKSYKGSLAVGTDGKLGVTGCVMFICQTRYWTRVK